MSRPFFYEHDNRAPSTSNYKPPMGRQKKFREPRGYGGIGKLRIDGDGDVDMSLPHSNVDRRFTPYGQRNNNNNRRKNKRHAGKNRQDRSGQRGDSNDFSWYKITIPHGKKSSKDFILKNISSLCRVPFTPFSFQFNGNAAEFFIKEYSVATHIKDVNRRITFPDGFKMAILMSRSAPPNMSIDAEKSDIIKKAMSERYDTISHTLNLSKFHHDAGLKELGLYFPLYKQIVAKAVVKIIEEHIPQLEILNLSDNRLFSLEAFSNLVAPCKQLKSLILQNNKLQSVCELDHLKGLELLDLVLDGNPLCDHFSDKATYISAVRDRFPKLLRLDSQELPMPIRFELGDEKLPSSKKSFFAAEDVKDLVIQFLDQYYTIYDSGDRSRLLEAYHDQANFSLCLSKHSQKISGSSLGVYSQENRNFMRTNNADRFKLLKQGKLAVVTALSDLPQTMHDPTSFSVDIYHISPGLMSFSVIGVFKEVGADINNAPLKTFSRTFVVVAQCQGFVIVNETLFIAHASQDQQSKAFKMPAPTPSPSPAPAEDKTAAEKQLLVVELSKQTGMNLVFSAKCLEENDWDYQRAVAVFLKFQSEGKLPPEAFVKTEPL